MQLLVLFGLPGTGKTYVGKILEKDFGFFLHDGDTDLG
jgi:shikimate kinase